MKHLAFLAAGILFTATTTLQAQPGGAKTTAGSAYLRAGIGYSFAHAGQTEILTGSGDGFRFNSSTTASNGTIGSFSTSEVKGGSFGAGGSIAIAGGYMLTRHIGIELGVNALVLPRRYEATEKGSGGGSFYDLTMTTKAELPVYIIPAIVLTTAGADVNVYSRFGAVLPARDKLSIKMEYNETTATGGGTTTAEYDLTNYFRVGIQAALGLTVPVKKNIGFWAEAVAISRNTYAKRLEMTAYSVDGVNRLQTFSINEKVTEFEFETTSGTTNNNPNNPRKAFTSSVPYSSIGIQAGLKFGL